MRSDTRPAESHDEVERLRADVAVLREAVRDLSATLDEQRDLLSNLNSIILRWDPEGRILYLNEYGQDFFGYTLGELVGRSVVGTIVPQTETSGRDLARLMHDILRNPGRYLSNENENMRRDGERVWVTWRNRPVHRRRRRAAGDRLHRHRHHRAQARRGRAARERASLSRALPVHARRAPRE